jgi:hypothetical protein
LVHHAQLVDGISAETGTGQGLKGTTEYGEATMLKHGRAVTGAVVVMVLLFQTACLRSMEPPLRLRPEDQRQVCAIRSADRVKIWTLDDQECQLNNAVVAQQALTGEWGGEEVAPFPFDSIARIQLYRRYGFGLGEFILGVLVGAGGLYAAALASFSYY